MGIIERLLEKQLRKMGYAPKQQAPGYMASEIESMPWATAGGVEPEAVTSYRDFIDAFKALPWIYAAATAISIATTKAKLKIYREPRGSEGKPEQVLGSDLNRLLAMPNPFLSWRELIQITAINIPLLGNAYWNLVGTSPDGQIGPANPPVEIWWIKPEEIEIIPHPVKFIDYYRHTSPTGKKKPLEVSEIVHFRLPNPDSYFRGLGALEPAKLAAELEFHAINYNKSFLKNDASADGGLFGTDQILEKTQVERFIRDWESRHKGTDRRGRVDVAWGGLKPLPIGVSPKDAQYVQMRKMNREEKLAVLGVPPSIVGLLEYANYSNMEVQQTKFWEDAVIPILAIVADKLTLNLGPCFEEGLYFEFDFSDVKALQEDEERKSRIAANLIGNAIRTPNQVRARMYNEEPYPGGDVYYMPLSMVPVGQDPKLPGGKPKNTPAVESKTGEKRLPSFWQAESRRKVLWESFVRRVSRRERIFEGKAKEFLEVQAEAVRKRAAKTSALSGISPEGLLDVETEAERWLAEFEARYLTALKEAGDAGMEASEGKIYIVPEERIMKGEDKFEVTPELREQMRKLIFESGTEIAEKTLEKIQAQLEIAMTEEWSVARFAQELRDKLVELSVARSRLISRTESSKVENWGQLEGYKQTEFIELKGWLCSFVPDSRESHKAADAKYSDVPIPLTEAFVITGEGGRVEMQYPGDPAGGAGEVCNCMCTTYPDVRSVE